MATTTTTSNSSTTTTAPLVLPWESNSVGEEGSVVSAGPIDLILRCVKGLYAGRYFHVCRARGGEVIGGLTGDPAVTVGIQHCGLSARHCNVRFHQPTAEYVIEDWDSPTGTWLAARPGEHLQIEDGSVIDLNGVLFHVRAFSVNSSPETLVYAYFNSFGITDELQTRIICILREKVDCVTLPIIRDNAACLREVLFHELKAPDFFLVVVALASIGEYIASETSEQTFLHFTEILEAPFAFFSTPLSFTIDWTGAYLVPSLPDDLIVNSASSAVCPSAAVALKAPRCQPDRPLTPEYPVAALSSSPDDSFAAATETAPQPLPLSASLPPPSQVPLSVPPSVDFFPTEFERPEFERLSHQHLMEPTAVMMHQRRPNSAGSEMSAGHRSLLMDFTPPATAALTCKPESKGDCSNSAAEAPASLYLPPTPVAASSQQQQQFLASSASSEREAHEEVPMCFSLRRPEKTTGEPPASDGGKRPHSPAVPTSFHGPLSAKQGSTVVLENGPNTGPAAFFSSSSPSKVRLVSSCVPLSQQLRVTDEESAGAGAGGVAASPAHGLTPPTPSDVDVEEVFPRGGGARSMVVSRSEAIHGATLHSESTASDGNAAFTATKKSKTTAVPTLPVPQGDSLADHWLSPGIEVASARLAKAVALWVKTTNSSCEMTSTAALSRSQSETPSQLNGLQAAVQQQGQKNHMAQGAPCERQIDLGCGPVTGATLFDGRLCPTPLATDHHESFIPPIGLRSGEAPLPLPDFSLAGTGVSELLGGLEKALLLTPETRANPAISSMLRFMPLPIVHYFFANGLPLHLPTIGSSSTVLATVASEATRLLQSALAATHQSNSSRQLTPEEYVRQQLELILRLRAWHLRLRDMNFIEELEAADSAASSPPGTLPLQFCCLTPSYLKQLLLQAAERAASGNAASTGRSAMSAVAAASPAVPTAVNLPAPIRPVIRVPVSCGNNTCIVLFRSGKYYLTLTQLGGNFDERSAYDTDPEVFVRLKPRKPYRLQPGNVFRIGDLHFLAKRLNVGTAGQQGYRPRMEDEETVVHMLPAVSQGLLSCQFYAVYDGHGGRQCAKFLSSRLHHSFSHQMYLQCPDVRLAKCLRRCVYDALYRAFVLTDRAFLRFYLCHKRRASPGSATIAAVIIGDTLWVANCGDARGVLCRAGRAVDLSDDHKPSRPDEERRIWASGGSVRAKRVLGRLAVSRALGDLEYKNIGLGRPPVVLGEPEIRMVTISPQDEFLLLACDGLFDVYTSQEAVDQIKQLFSHQQDPLLVVQSLVQEAIEGRKSRDNVTAVLVKLARRVE